jgi:cardiolipin synthase
VSDSPAFPPASISVDGHDLTLVVDGAARLAHILAIISGAGRSLRLFYYIFEDDPAGRDVLGALLAARARGVEVTLLIDGFGSSALPDNFFAPLIDAGGRMARFIPHKGRRYLLRNHQKMLIADERVALIGGANIAEDYFRDTETQDHWHDLMLEISGPKVENLAVYFDALNGWVGSQDRLSVSIHWRARCAAILTRRPRSAWWRPISRRNSPSCGGWDELPGAGGCGW